MITEERRKSRNLCFGALLAALAAIIQISPLYFPFVGISLSAFSTLPIAIAAYLKESTGAMTYLISSILIAFWSPPQAVIFLCISGLLGLILGILMKRKFSWYLVVGLSALSLLMGLFVVSKIIGLPVFPWLAGTNRIYFFPLVIFFSCLYSFIWIPILGALFNRLGHYF